MKILLSPYDPYWPRMFEEEAAKIRAALGDRALEIFHVGSTSVPGLRAKPIIDILLTLEDSSAESDYLPDMEAAGYKLRVREPDWFEHRMFTRPSGEINLHVFTKGSSEVERMLRFRERLRVCETEKRLYEETKQALAEREWGEVQDYADAKTQVINEILARAEPSLII